MLEERYAQSSSFCQPDPKFTMFMLNIFLSVFLFFFFFQILSIRFEVTYWGNKVTVKKKIGLRKVYISEIK